ncbi:hypothetical protein QPK87_35825 [Kamptonema cortianum]|uniref:Uncharacterized protein n=1 Tax=Geitlerinema calcuttense NRMC-F 0142 TaxID=2922238 RepID=A0ABT7M0S5_9CYAN|nr:MULTISPECIES: hypothetical protein [Cyanophyceae]MDK3161883.1 hypothetical protein [Kamptonema cortianum]MDL5050561.1 hypothetical protein [Oscillatoria amoena NRMC-F 0135]MDL5055576.1 hypothetical protein [Oscillatoria laete-virens NRMC-F 0139]MDL5057858.1 hypothetical protein [Geitlerinema calcuttense NRMC-F 0142]
MSTLQNSLAAIDGVQVVWSYDRRGNILSKTISDYTDEKLKEISTLLASLAFMHAKNSGPLGKLHYAYKHHQLWTFADGENWTALIADEDADIASQIAGV